MNKSISEQLDIINKILPKREGSRTKKTYAIKGATYTYKEDLKSWGWKWNAEVKAWCLFDVFEDDASLRIVDGLPKTWVEEL